MSCVMSSCCLQRNYTSQIILVFAPLRNYDGSRRTRALNTGGIYKFREVRPISGYMWETIQDRTMVTTER